MMTQEQAAKYLIVAWVKDWSMRMYLNVIGGDERIDWAEAHNRYQWLPKDPGWFMRNTRVRRYVAEAMRKINDRLWDAKDNNERLLQSTAIAGWNGSAAVQTMNAVRGEEHKARKELLASGIAYRASVDAMRRGGGHAWNVCK
jgi:hypothetical protein